MPALWRALRRDIDACGRASSESDMCSAREINAGADGRRACNTTTSARAALRSRQRQLVQEALLLM